MHLLQVGEVECGGQEHGALVQQILRMYLIVHLVQVKEAESGRQDHGAFHQQILRINLIVHLLQVGEVESGGQEHGALVQQILQTQQELQDGNRITKGGVQIVSITITVLDWNL